MSKRKAWSEDPSYQPPEQPKSEPIELYTGKGTRGWVCEWYVSISKGGPLQLSINRAMQPVRFLVAGARNGTRAAGF